MTSKSRTPVTPSKEDVLKYIRESPTAVGKREIARAFGLRGDDKAVLKDILRELRDEGILDRGRKRRVRPKGSLPPVAIIDVITIDADGDVVCRPAKWDDEADVPVIYLRPGQRRGIEPGKGDRVLAKIKRLSETTYEAVPIRILGQGPRTFIGVYHPDHDKGWVEPTDRRTSGDFRVTTLGVDPVQPGDVVVAEILDSSRGRTRNVRITDVIGHTDNPSVFSLIALQSRDIPIEFPRDAVEQANEIEPATVKGRTDLRHVPMVTIDGADARDFDDAVWAETSENGGWRAIVAIADVSWYVRPGSALDKAAFERGTSVYFPDRVVPMLPERLSNDLCSLRPGEDRACVAAFMEIGKDGQLKTARFERALMRSCARLTYEQVQTAHDGNPDENTAPLLDTVIAPLYGVFDVLLAAREKRGTLDLDLPELQIELGDDGHVGQISPQKRLDSHRLIEELMITANVAAARYLQKANRTFLYRIHAPPSMDKLESLRASLDALGYKLVKGTIRTTSLAGILEQAAAKDQARLVNELVLRSQSKAEYNPENEGHFGLALKQYCHFTSPIRRYPDVIVHRALVNAGRLGPGGLTEFEEENMVRIGEQTSNAERRAEAAERDARARYLTAFMADRVGASFTGRISGVSRFGVFVTLDETGADGLVPVSSLPWDRYFHDEEANRLTGEETGQSFAMGMQVTVELKEANVNTGGLIFHIVKGGDVVKQQRRRGRKNRVSTARRRKRR